MSRRLTVVAVTLGAMACGGSTDQDSSGSGGSGAVGAGPGIGGVGATAGIGGEGGGTSGVGAGGGIDPGAMNLVGTWKGYVENYKFSDATDTVSLVLSNAALVGNVTFGMGAPLPPPTDPNVGYPPGMSGTFSGPPTMSPFVGFPYSVTAPSFDGERLQFDLHTTELWKLWCEMQTPIADEVNAGMYSCLPNWGSGSLDGKCFQTNPQTQENVPVDCGKMALCSMGSPCQCTAQGCTVSTASGGTIHFDMVVAPPKADGSVSGLSGVSNVHLKKQ